MKMWMMIRKRAGNCSALSAESRFRRMVEGLRREYFFYCHGADGVFQYVSPSVRNILGYSPREFLGRFDTFLTGAAVNLEVRRHTALSIKGVRQPPYEVEVYHKDGSVRTLEVLEIPVRERGRVVFVEGIARDITEQRRAQVLLAEHDREMTAQAGLILQSSGDGIIGVDMAGCVTFINNSAERMLGWTAGELKGKELHPVIHHSRPDGSKYRLKDCPMQAVLVRGRESRVENEVLWRKDGSSLPVTYSARPILRGGKPAGVVITFSDVTERKRLSELKEFLMHSIVHDLNNPLTAIMAGTELAAECPGGRAACDNREQLSMVFEMAMDMKKMIADILDISRMEEGVLRLRRKPCAPAALAASAASAMASVAKLNKRVVTSAVPAGLPRVGADTAIIKRILENLISNALRYAPRDTPVTVSAVRARSGKTVIFSVSDHGPGIRAAHLEKVFDKYFQSDPAAGSGRAGKGLGLTFCRLAVESHGGRIWVENLRPRGCRFSFELPVTASGRAGGRG